MKPFNLEAAKRGEPIFDDLMGVVVHFVGFAANGDYLIEYRSHLCRRTENDLRMAEPRRPEWQQDLIDAVEAGKIVEFNPHTPDFWQTSDPDFWQTSAPDFWRTSDPDFWRTSDPDFWQTSELNRYSSSYDFRGSTKDQFRIRPEKVTRYLWAFKYPAGQRWVRSNIFMSDEEAKAESSGSKIQRLDWSATVFEE